MILPLVSHHTNMFHLSRRQHSIAPYKNVNIVTIHSVANVGLNSCRSKRRAIIPFGIASHECVFSLKKLSRPSYSLIWWKNEVYLLTMSVFLGAVELTIIFCCRFGVGGRKLCTEVWWIRMQNQQNSFNVIECYCNWACVICRPSSSNRKSNRLCLCRWCERGLFDRTCTDFVFDSLCRSAVHSWNWIFQCIRCVSFACFD